MAAIKSATPVRGPHSGQDSDDGMSDNEELDLSADGTLDKKFTATQLTLLHAAKGEYKEASPGMRAEIANRVAETFMTKIEETGRRLKRKEKRGLTRLVRKWFSQRCRKRRQVSMWQVKWNKRQVFYKQNSGLVAARQRLLYNVALDAVADVELKGESVKKEVAEVDIEYVGDVAEPDEAPPLEPTKLTPFFFFQRALSDEMALLDDDELEVYERMADEWNEKGPSDEEKKRLAEKDAIRAAREFHTTMWTRMGVRMFTFLAYEDIVGEIVVSMEDNSKQLGLHSFKSEFRSALRATNIFRLWKRFANVEFQEEEIDLPIRGRSKPLLLLETNSHGEPIIPCPSNKVKDWPQWEYLPHLIRTIVTGCLALASGKAKEHLHVKWSLYAKDVRVYIASNFVPDNLTALFREPSSLKVNECLLLLTHWYGRQESGLIAFEFENYIDDQGEAVPREARVFLPVVSSTHEERKAGSADNIELSPQATPLGHKTKIRGAPKSTTRQGRSNKNRKEAPAKRKGSSKADRLDEDIYGLANISARLGVTEEDISASVVQRKIKKPKAKARGRVIVSATSAVPSGQGADGGIWDYASIGTNDVLTSGQQRNVKMEPDRSISAALSVKVEEKNTSGILEESVSMAGRSMNFDNNPSHRSHLALTDFSLSRPSSPPYCAADHLSKRSAVGGPPMVVDPDAFWNGLSATAKADLLRLAPQVISVDEGVRTEGPTSHRPINVSPRRPLPARSPSPDSPLPPAPLPHPSLASAAITSSEGDSNPSGQPEDNQTVVKAPREPEHVRLAREAEGHKYWGLKGIDTPRVKKATVRYDPSR